MLEWTGAPCIDTIGIPCGSKSPIVIVFLVSDKSRNAVMICSDSASSITLRDASGVKFGNSIPIFWCP